MRSTIDNMKKDNTKKQETKANETKNIKYKIENHRTSHTKISFENTRHIRSTCSTKATTNPLRFK